MATYKPSRIRTLLLIAAVIVLAALTGCSTRRAAVVELPQVREVHDTVRLASVTRDTVAVWHTVTLREQGDTLRVDRIVERTRLRIDTAYRVLELRDTVTVAVSTPAALTTSQQARLRTWPLLAALAALLAVVLMLRKPKQVNTW